MIRTIVMWLALSILTIGSFFGSPPLALPFGLLLTLLVVAAYTAFKGGEGDLARWILGAVFLVNLTLFVAAWYFLLWHNGSLPEGYDQTLILRTAALGVAGLVSLVLTSIFALVTVYVSSVYVLSLHKTEEDISLSAIMRSFLAVLLNTNYDWMIISDGEVKITRPGGVMKFLGGPGKIVIEPGNVVVLQSGGNVTRVKGAGIVLTERFENIKEIVNLRNQFTVISVENVITVDKIPLTITMGIGYRIKPADDPNADGVIKDTKGLFAVDEQTILNAVYQNTTRKWTGFGSAAPVVQLRDQIMSYTLDELFLEKVGTPNMRQIKQIEDEILANLNTFAPSLGVIFTTVDIQQIKLPEKVAEAIEIKVRAEAEAEAIERIESARTQILKNMINQILGELPEHERNSESALNLVKILVEQNKRILTDDILGHQYLEMLNKMASADGTKIFTPKSNR